MPSTGSHRARPSGGLSIRAHLVLYGLALVLPILAFSGVLLWRFATLEQQRYEAEAQQIVRQAAIAVDQRIAASIATLQALATSPSLQEGDLRSFHEQARRTDRIADSHIALRDLGGLQLVNTRLPWGTPLPVAPDREADLQVVATRAPYVSDLVPSTVRRRPIVTASVPVMKGGDVAYVLSMSFPTERLQELVAVPGLPQGWTVGLVDRKGRFVARSRDHAASVGRRAGQDVTELGDRSEGVVERLNVDGQRVVFAFARPRQAGWLVGLGIPRERMDAPLWRSLWIVLGLGASVLFLSLGLAYVFGRRIAAPIRALATAAGALGRGEPVEPLSTGLQEAGEVGRSLVTASEDLRHRSALLAASEERYRLATEAFQGAVFDYDVATDRAQRTRRHYEIVGEEPGGFSPTRLGWYERIHPEDRSTFDAAREPLFASGASEYEAEYRVRHRDGSWVWVWHRALAMRDGSGRLLRVVGAILDVTERKRFEEHLRLLVDELNHRVKNTLATIQSIAFHTLRSSGSDLAARKAFEARLLALSSAHDVLTRRNWESALLGDVVLAALEPHRVDQGTRFTVDGPEVEVGPRDVLALSLALHELATNAAKYGALSGEEGLVEVRWRQERTEDGESVVLSWRERGGPPAAPPSRWGFGSRLVERSLSQDLGGQVVLAYPPEGVTCEVRWRPAASR